MTARASKRARTPRSALLIVDMINPLDFPGARALLRQSIQVATRIHRLRRRMKERGLPTIYVNDNFSHWLRDFRELVAICSQPGASGAPLATLLAPEHDDYLVLKPKHSGFFATPLEVLLAQLDVRHVVVTGIAGDGCVLATATDAHMRDLEVSVPSDCCASISKARNERALRLLRESMKIDTRLSRYL